MSKLIIDFKRKRSTQWELQVRHHAKVNAECCDSLSSFCYSFNEDLKKYPRTNTGHIANAYQALLVDDHAVIRWFSPTSDNKDIAVITLSQN